MWIVKGVLVGFLMFGTIFAVRFRRRLFHGILGPDALRQMTVHSTAFWIGLIGCVLVGCTIAWYWWSPTK